EALKRGNAHGRGDFTHLPVRADIDHVVVVSEAEVSHEANLVGKFAIIRHDGSTLERVDKFGCVKAECLGRSEGADCSTTMRASDRMLVVVNDSLPVRPRDLIESLDIAGSSPEMDANDTRLSRCDQFLDALRIYGVRLTIHVTE